MTGVDGLCASQASIKATFTALSSFYGYLFQEGAALIWSSFLVPLG